MPVSPETVHDLCGERSRVTAGLAVFCPELHTLPLKSNQEGEGGCLLGQELTSEYSRASVHFKLAQPQQATRFPQRRRLRQMATNASHLQCATPPCDAAASPIKRWVVESVSLAGHGLVTSFGQQVLSSHDQVEPNLRKHCWGVSSRAAWRPPGAG